MRTLFCLVLSLLILSPLCADEKDKPAKKKPTITGQVEFAKKPEFEKGTEVKIQVRDTSIADAKAVLIGEQILKDPKGGPIAFEVEYDGDKVKQGRRYSISCRITHKGKLIYINDTNIPVINAPGKTKDVKLPVIAVR